VSPGQQVAASQARTPTPNSGSLVAALHTPKPNAAPGRELAFALASEARRTGLLTALHRMSPTLTLDRLDVLLRGRHGEDLAQLTIAQLTKATPRGTIWLAPGQPIEDTVMDVFRVRAAEWFSSGFFVRHMGLRRWTAQKLLAEFADRGWLRRKGKTSGTRYRLAARLTASRGLDQ
jgi:hypothetical protein